MAVAAVEVGVAVVARVATDVDVDVGPVVTQARRLTTPPPEMRLRQGLLLERVVVWARVSTKQLHHRRVRLVSVWLAMTQANRAQMGELPRRRLVLL